MDITRIKKILEIDQLKSGIPFSVNIKNKTYTGILIDHKKAREIKNFLDNYNLTIFGLRGDENNDTVPATIENRVVVNNFGDFILEKNEFNLKNKEYEAIQEYSYL